MSPAAQQDAAGSGPAQPGASESGRPTASPGRSGRLVLARHGQTDHNLNGRLQGQIDIPLNERGREQAASLAAALQHDPPDVIVCSPLSRARETAEAVSDATGVPVLTDPGLLERGFGDWEGLTDAEIGERWPEEHRAWRHHHEVPDLGMETREEVAHRVGEACRRLLREHEGRRVLAVAHGAAITLGITDLLGLDAASFRGIAGLENCHRSILEPLRADPEGRLMRLLSHNISPDFP